MNVLADAEGAAPASRWEDELRIDRSALSALLLELGVDLQTDLAPSYMLATQDMLMCVELAETLPQGGDYLAACSVLQTGAGQQPEPGQLAQQAVARHFLGSLGELPQARLRALLARLDL